jgi:hypothetical protein
LRGRHAHGFGGFQDRRVDTGKADVSVAEDWKKCVQDERDDGSALADAADEWNGNEKSEESEAGDGLEVGRGTMNMPGGTPMRMAMAMAITTRAKLSSVALRISPRWSRIKVQGLTRVLPEKRKGMK